MIEIWLFQMFHPMHDVCIKDILFEIKKTFMLQLEQCKKENSLELGMDFSFQNVTLRVSRFQTET